MNSETNLRQSVLCVSLTNGLSLPVGVFLEGRDGEQESFGLCVKKSLRSEPQKLLPRVLKNIDGAG
jgi:hypothetical protein